MRESEIEGYLRKQVEKNGGKCWKWVSPGRLGVPDRIVLMPYGTIAFVETKAPGKTERASQKLVQRILRKLGFTVFSSVDTKEKVDLALVSILAFVEINRFVREHVEVRDDYTGPVQ